MPCRRASRSGRGPSQGPSPVRCPGYARWLVRFDLSPSLPPWSSLLTSCQELPGLDDPSRRSLQRSVAGGTDKTGPKIDRTYVRHKYLRLGLTGWCLRTCDYRSDRPSQRESGQGLVDGAAGLQVGTEQGHLAHLQGLLVQADLPPLQSDRGGGP